MIIKKDEKKKTLRASQKEILFLLLYSVHLVKFTTLICFISIFIQGGPKVKTAKVASTCETGRH